MRQLRKFKNPRVVRFNKKTLTKPKIGNLNNNLLEALKIIENSDLNKNMEVIKICGKIRRAQLWE